MRSAFACLKLHRHAILLCRSTLQYGRVDSSIETVLLKWLPFNSQKYIDSWDRPEDAFPHYLLPRRLYSAGYTSVHGERPSAEYAKLRKESLESEFGHALGTYSSKSFSSVYRFGPFLALYRAAIISFHVLKLTIWHFFVHDIRKRAVKFRKTLIRLGPFYVKSLMKRH